jgi:DNA polymerase III alpha subunit
MKPTVTDIDIDVPDRKKVLELFPHTVANNGKAKHNTGVYFHRVPVNPMTGRCSIDYDVAEELGYFKIDVLNVSIYKDVESEDHLLRLLDTEPLWELLQEKDFCDLLFHMRGHHEICQQMKPKDLLQLAAVLALIRPAKRHLVGRSWNYVMKHIWTQPQDGGYAFKKSHSVSYAMAVKLHMNLITEQMNSE